MTSNFNYPFELRPVEQYEGGGWLIVFPDLPGCMSDGETPEEAVANGRDAVSAWITAAREAGREVPGPGDRPSGKFIARIPTSLHARLAARARQEGVSMNALVTAFLAESIGRRENRLAKRERRTVAEVVERALEEYSVHQTGREPAAEFYGELNRRCASDLDLEQVIQSSRQPNSGITL